MALSADEQKGWTYVMISSPAWTSSGLLSGLAIRQGIAITGSMNQNGQVQAIGGVTRKSKAFSRSAGPEG
jgi:hypothetical protein